jgi:hypothetical protein
MNTAGVSLLSNAAATSAAKKWPGGRGVMSVAGTFGGAAVTMQFLGPDGSTYLDVKAMAPDGTQTAVSLAAAGAIGFVLPPTLIKVVVTGGAPSGLYARADRVPE